MSKKVYIKKADAIEVRDSYTTALEDTYPVSIFNDKYFEGSTDTKYNILKMFFLSGQDTMELEVL